jgi:hypothetical protein
MTGPDFDELAEGMSPAERAQLRRAHDLLLAAGPPPELPPYLAEAPRMKKQKAPALTTVPRRRFGALVTAAAGIAAAAFVIGYVVANVGGSGDGDTIVVRDMHSTPAAPGAAAVIDVKKGGEGGNIPLNVTVSGLRKLGEGGYYELWLTRVTGTSQKKVVSCGTFVASGTDKRFVVKLNAPYRLEDGVTPGWIVTRHERGATTTPVVLTT